MPVLISDLYRDVQLPNLEKFNPDEIKLDATLVFVGKRRTGKSWAILKMGVPLSDRDKKDLKRVRKIAAEMKNVTNRL